jgi:hypothetical protein
MSLCTTYIYAQVKDALIPETNLEPTIDPVVAPSLSGIFSDEIMRKLGFYKDTAIYVEDFESWISFLEKVATELGLSPANDLEKLASVFNLYRVEVGKDPL